MVEYIFAAEIVREAQQDPVIRMGGDPCRFPPLRTTVDRVPNNLGSPKGRFIGLQLWIFQFTNKWLILALEGINGPKNKRKMTARSAFIGISTNEDA